MTSTNPAPTIGLVTDSSAQIPANLAERFGVEVVPITVVMDGVEHAEGMEGQSGALDPDAFWAAFDDHVPEVSTSQPSPGMFAQAYQRLADAGCESVLSVHIGEAFSGTLNSARLGASMVGIPVQLVDTGSMSFGVSCCLWGAADAIGTGAGIEDAAAAAVAVSGATRTSFIVQALDFARAGGRVGDRLPEGSDGVPVMVAGPGDAFASVGAGHSVDELCDLMADAMHCDGLPINVGVSLADPSTAPFADGLEARLRARGDVVELVRYRVGASVGAHTGPGTAGGFWFPTV